MKLLMLPNYIYELVLAYKLDPRRLTDRDYFVSLLPPDVRWRFYMFDEKLDACIKGSNSRLSNVFSMLEKIELAPDSVRNSKGEICSHNMRGLSPNIEYVELISSDTLLCVIKTDGVEPKMVLSNTLDIVRDIHAYFMQVNGINETLSSELTPVLIHKLVDQLDY